MDQRVAWEHIQILMWVVLTDNSERELERKPSYVRFGQSGNQDLGENQGAKLFGCVDAPCRSLISFRL